MALVVFCILSAFMFYQGKTMKKMIKKMEKDIDENTADIKSNSTEQLSGRQLWGHSHRDGFFGYPDEQQGIPPPDFMFQFDLDPSMQIQHTHQFTFDLPQT
jgi:hypothetical protein